MSLNKFDGIFYINLSHRKDRREKMESQLDLLSVDRSKIIRIEACHDLLNGHKGCASSHIKALDLAKKKKLSKVLILEDDMGFSKSKKEVDEYVDRFFETMENEWDVFFLATNVFEYEETDFEHIKRVRSSLCAHAYGVNAHYFEILRQCFIKAHDEMEDGELFMDAKFKAIDRRWVDLQKIDRWFIGKYPIGHQSRSYSDIEHEIRDRRHQTILD